MEKWPNCHKELWGLLRQLRTANPDALKELEAMKKNFFQVGFVKISRDFSALLEIY